LISFSIIIIPKFLITFKNAVILNVRVTALVICKLETLKNLCYNIYREEKLRVKKWKKKATTEKTAEENIIRK